MLSDEDIPRLKRQALSDLRENSDPEINFELAKSYCLLNMIESGLIAKSDVKADIQAYLDFPKIYFLLNMVKSGFIHLLNDRQIAAYVDHKDELQTVLLQFLHQHSVPAELFYSILTHITGLDRREAADLNDKIIAKHESEFPAFQLRRQ